ncbi:MAG: alpha/beta hydrolase [Steroidobacteraceae bacterium]
MSQTADSVALLPAGDRASPGGERAGYFANGDGQRLYGVLNPAGALPGRRPGVVFCAPLSEERHYCQRVIVDYARFLAQAGYPTLRFDVAGCGDSDGDMVAVTIPGLLRDVRAAIDHLIASSGAPRVVLVGVRFGAMLAQITAGIDARVSGAALIAPLVSGIDYWNTLLRSQQMSCMTRGLKAPKLEELRHSLASTGQIEIKGELYGQEFGETLATVDLRAASERRRVPLLIAAGADEPPDGGAASQLLATAQAAGADATAMPDPVGVFWSSKALYRGFRPDALFHATRSWLERLAP